MLQPVHHKSVSVIFIDVCNYTKMCSETPIIDCVKLIHRLFTSFDKHLDIYKIEQVQIIGDAYMAISGHLSDISSKNKHATNIIDFAIKILEESLIQNIPIKIGISCGSVIAAKIGINNKIVSYYGDTVNMASRMESYGFPNCIHISQIFLDRLDIEDYDKYKFIQVGYRFIKGKGSINTYLCCFQNYWRTALIVNEYRKLDNKRCSFEHINEKKRLSLEKPNINKLTQKRSKTSFEYDRNMIDIFINKRRHSEPNYTYNDFKKKKYIYTTSYLEKIIEAVYSLKERWKKYISN